MTAERYCRRCGHDPEEHAPTSSRPCTRCTGCAGYWRTRRLSRISLGYSADAVSRWSYRRGWACGQVAGAHRGERRRLARALRMLGGMTSVWPPRGGA